MFITRFELHGYKPLLHNNIHHVVVEDLSQLTVLVAPNGFGKSSILRELTPYPACRSDYDKTGKKLIELIHNNSSYVLLSDFSKTSGAHSFIKDDVELNASGTTEVQETLVEQYLGYTRVIDKLLSGEYQICSMGPAQRKELIYDTYPSSLSFILDKYAKLKSKIKTINGQLKLLNERKLKLTDLILREETLNQFVKFRESLIKANAALDMDIYAYTKMKTEISNKVYATKDAVSWESIRAECDDLSRKMRILSTTDGVDIVEPDKLDTLIGSLSTAIDYISNKRETLTATGSRISEEIEKLKETINNDTSKSISECKKLIKIQEKIIRDNPIDVTIPVVSLEEADKMEEHREQLSNDLRYLRDIGKILSRDEFNTYQQELDTKTLELNRLSDERNKIDVVIVALKSKIDNLKKKHSYPNDCTRTCQMRANLEEVIRSVQLDLDTKLQEQAKLIETIPALDARVTEIARLLVPQRAARPLFTQLDTFFTRKSWGYFVCSELTPREAINNDITKIINNYSKVIHQARKYVVVKDAKEMLATLQAKLVGLKTSDRPVKEYLTKTLLDKEHELQVVDDELTKLDKEFSSISTSLTTYQRHKKLHIAVLELKDKYDLWKRRYIATQELQCITESIDYLQDVKAQISTKLRELDTIVTEQQGYLTRLKEEIEPSIQSLTDELTKISAVADQLSPVSGIPYKYTVRYVNVLFQLANTYIRRVWNYDIELAYVDENKQSSFDFTFQLLVNHNSEVKDIRLCSKSQKSIINLAIRLAICVYRGYISNYPIKLDEIDDGFSPLHQEKLTEFLVELLNQHNILQGFIVHQSIAVSSSFTNAGMVVLAGNELLPENCVIKSKVS